jgi:hypothetical protein
MSATLNVKCPNCNKSITVPANLVGKLIRCKGCESPFEVTDPSTKPTKPAPAKPVAAKPVAAKPAVPTKPPIAITANPVAAAKPIDTAPLAFKDDPPPAKNDDDEDEETANPYGVIKESDAPRCPHCAKELDPPDARVCLHCGYNLLERRRRESKKVYETTTGDYVKHLLPGVVCIGVIFFLLSISICCGLKMRGWLTGSLLDTDEKNPITGQTIFLVGPLCFNIWLWIICAWLAFLCGRFAIRRLIFNWRPTEIVKHDEED